MVLARIDRLVFGASDPKAGAVGSLLDLSADPRLNHRFPVERGVLAEESGELLRAFFRARRGNGNGPES
jgi:tRNA(adenine34) deaminase